LIFDEMKGLERKKKTCDFKKKHAMKGAEA